MYSASQCTVYLLGILRHMMSLLLCSVGEGRRCVLCKSCHFKGVNIPNKKKTKKGVKPKNFNSGPMWRLLLPLWQTPGQNSVKPSACNVCGHVAVCLGRAAGVFRPSYIRRGKVAATSHHIFCLYLLTGVRINTHNHTIGPSSVGDPALFKHSFLFRFFNLCKNKKKSSIKPVDCMATLNTDAMTF